MIAPLNLATPGYGEVSLNWKIQNLKECRWWIGRGINIPLTHHAWFPYLNQNPNNLGLQTSTVADLINQNSRSWKPDLVQALYPYPSCNEILSYPISRTGTISNKILWKHSTLGDFKFHKAYSLLQKDYNSTYSNQHRYNSIPHDVWTLIWKVKQPLKIGNFVWKLMHDYILTFLALKNRGIPIPSTSSV